MKLIGPRRRMAAAVIGALSASAPQPDFFPFQGGLDQTSSPFSIEPGRVKEALNFEASRRGGYRRIPGYERFDGQAKPSEGRYAILSLTITGAIAAGDSIVGATSAATATVLAVVTNETPNYLVITKITGTFQSAEDLNIGGLPEGATLAVAVVDGASTTLLHAQYKNLAADEYRSDIAAVPGSGNILGVIHYEGNAYAFRNNADGTAAAIYKSTTSGWSAVTLYNEVSFTAGTTEPADGETLTQGGVTATIKRVVTESGPAWSGSAAGRFIIANPAGGNFSAGAATTSGGATISLSGAQAAITILPNGAYEFDKVNFGGDVNTTRIYGCDGVNRGFEFDGDVYVPIVTGMTTDTPTHVTGHHNHLFFAFGGSAQHSGITTPYQWTLLSGANELAMGDTITGFAVQPGSQDKGALAIFTRNRASILYGTSSSDWNLTPYRKELGAIARTIEDVGFTMFLDDRGITDLQTSQSFGNFAHSAISNDIHPFLNEHRTLVTASCISRDQSQYRLFFSDGYGIYVTLIGKKLMGMMPVLFDDPVLCTYSGENTDGSEIMLFGSDNGFVYEMDKGTSFDGDAIEYYLGMPFHFSRSPRLLKRYHGGVFEMTGDGYSAFSFTFDLGYASGEADTASTQSLTTSFSAGRWDTGNWDTGAWDGRTLIPTTFDLTGSAENIALRMQGSSDYQEPFTFHGVLLDSTARRRLRA